MSTRIVSGEDGARLLVKAGLQALPGLNLLPGVRKSPPQEFTGISLGRPPVTVERAHVAAYAEVCGFPIKDTVPLTYPHLLGFGLQMAILTDAAFPGQAIGTVHLENAITQRRPIGIGETLDVTASVGSARPHPKGTTYAFRTEVRSDGDLVWDGVSTYLRRGYGSEGAASGTVFPDAPPTGATWRLPGDLGRRYAAVSGDHNPIHLYRLTAKPLGFPRQIAHGMWSKARCVAALENRLPDAVRVEAAFKKPILLPGTVAFGSAPVDQGYAFSLTSPKSGAPHVVGRTTAL